MNKLSEPKQSTETREVVWVPTNKVFPNPLNPRQNNSIQAEQIQQILLKYGFEEPLTVYRKGDIYVLLAGHRRLYAAKKQKLDEVPVYIVDTPQSEQEELERIASLQSGRVDWSQYEWGRFAYDRWLQWNKPPVARFAKEMQLKPSQVKQYITVFSTYPRMEIEDGLLNGTLNFSILAALIVWIENLKKYKRPLVDAMGEDMIRKFMLEKIALRRISRDQVRYVAYCKHATREDIQEFLTDRDATLDEAIHHISLEQRYQNFNGHMISLGVVKNRIPNIKVETEHQRKTALAQLEELKTLIEKQIKEIDA